MKNLWLYLVNTFEVNTRTSKRKMLRISNHHLARLNAMKTDPDILAMFDIFEPAAVLYQTMMSDFTSFGNISQGNTHMWKKYLNEMSEGWIDEWQTMVRQQYEKNTPEYIAIFPNGKEPFLRTQYDMRMIAVEALHTTLLTYPSLSDAATNVATRLALLKNARNVQTQSFGTKDFTSSMVEDQRKVLADLLDDNLCKLKIKYRNNIKVVENYFDLAELRKPSNDADSRFVHSGAVEAGMTAAVQVPARLNLSAADSCVFANKSNVAQLEFFFSASSSAADNPVKTTVLPMDSALTNAAEAGWAPGASYIIVKNTGTITAEFDLSVTEALES